MMIALILKWLKLNYDTDNISYSPIRLEYGDFSDPLTEIEESQFDYCISVFTINGH